MFSIFVTLGVFFHEVHLCFLICSPHPATHSHYVQLYSAIFCKFSTFSNIRYIAVFSSIGHTRHIQLYSYIGNSFGSIHYIWLRSAKFGIYIYIHSLYSPLFCIFAIFNNIRYICYVQLSLLCAPYSLRGTRFAVFVILIYLRKIRLSFVYSLSSTIFAIFALFSYICHMRLIRYMGLTFLYSLIFSAMFASLLDSGRFFLQMAGPPELLCARLCAGAMCAMCGRFAPKCPLGAGWPPVIWPPAGQRNQRQPLFEQMYSAVFPYSFICALCTICTICALCTIYGIYFQYLALFVINAMFEPIYLYSLSFAIFSYICRSVVFNIFALFRLFAI